MSLHVWSQQSTLYCFGFIWLVGGFLFKTRPLHLARSSLIRLGCLDGKPQGPACVVSLALGV